MRNQESGNDVNANAILQRYAAMERDFQHLSFSQASLRGVNLSGTDFSHANLNGG